MNTCILKTCTHAYLNTWQAGRQARMHARTHARTHAKARTRKHAPHTHACESTKAPKCKSAKAQKQMHARTRARTHAHKSKCTHHGVHTIPHAHAVLLWPACERVRMGARGCAWVHARVFASRTGSTSRVWLSPLCMSACMHTFTRERAYIHERAHARMRIHPQ